MDLTKEMVKDAIKELHQEGCFNVGCPWDGVPNGKIEALKTLDPLPIGAAKMVLITWNILSTFGQKMGQAMAAGIFIALCALILAGAFGFGKVLQVIIGAFGK
jgi:hypothetical protein